MDVKYILYVVLLLNRNINTAYGSDINDTFKITDRVFSCSNWLSSLIDNICNNVYKIVKRDTSLMIEKMAPKDLQKSMYKQRLLTEEHWRRVRRQVASECCERACTVGNIIMYCPDDAKLLRENPDIFY
ncbi:PREDICTED: uncharacterized protein LOC106115675 isoform X1 [Papilio xuthus]|uniref:Uncharacterized protein LOC106115675 isoform X1 n=1 Tax=Papilio xuthus TaxID=66420 RepID=A0AAJ6Z394_PAPXU|nr:PREDICTED: uncharacterized protein LOC106103593 isoform X1 [Papilio polytes]XP_013164583.1 PREDICTED: uncharacterized protein LOC106115675 isoform X1 [Papilio xuthus]XP_014370916.1 uncharacterized protein LOC106720686 [Papilio machaon]